MQLEQLTGHRVAGSIDTTGNAPRGNWMLERHNRDVSDFYFTEQLQDFQETLLLGTPLTFSGSNVSADTNRSRGVVHWRCEQRWVVGCGVCE